MEGGRLGSALRRGLQVIIALAVLTAIEYGVPIVLDRGANPYLAILALIKAGLIAYYFMHIAQLWRQEE